MTDSPNLPAIPERRGPGRPLTPIPDLARVSELAALGLTLEQIAMRLGMHVTTFARMLNAHPEIREAARAGKAAAIEDMANTLHMRAKAGDTACLIFWLKCQAGWTQPRQEVAVTVQQSGAGTGALLDSHVSELAARHSALLDEPDPDAIEAEWEEVVEATEATEAEPSADELADMMS